VPRARFTSILALPSAQKWSFLSSEGKAFLPARPVSPRDCRYAELEAEP